MSWNRIFFDHSIDFAGIARAVDYARARGLETLRYNFPLCSVLEPHRQIATSTIPTGKKGICTRAMTVDYALRVNCDIVFLARRPLPILLASPKSANMANNNTTADRHMFSVYGLMVA